MHAQQLVIAKQKIAEAKVPVQYENACRALAECVTVDEAMLWNDKSDALAAWAKIYRNDLASRQARLLKNHAFKRMGEIADELRPIPKERYGHSGQQSGIKGFRGARSLLIEKGLTTTQAAAAVVLARMDEKTFTAIQNADKVLSPSTIARSPINHSIVWTKAYPGLAHMRSFTRSNVAKDIVAGMDQEEIEPAISLVREVMEWLDQFEYYLSR